MHVIVWLRLECFKVGAHPSDAFIEALIEVDTILPTEFCAQLGAVEMVGGVFAHALADNFNLILETYVQFAAYPLDEFADGNHLVGRNMVGVAISAMLHDLPCGIGNVAHMDK